MYVFIIKILLRNKVLLSALIALAIIGVLGVAVGKQFLNKQQAAIEQTTQFQQQHIQRNVEFFNKEMGLLLYYLQFAYINKLDNIAALSIGQKDVQPSIQQVTIRGLQAQVYDADLINPTNIMYGNMDVSFVLIYLFPLVIIAFTFNILSEEKETGIWTLIRIQSKNNFSFLLQKISAAGVLIFGVYVFIMLLAVLILQLELNTSLFLFFTTGSLYLLFWLLVCFVVALLQHSSATNALVLLSCWVMFTMVVPGFVNNYAQKKYALPEAYTLTVQQRNSYHEKWDLPKEPTVTKFLKHYPQFKNFTLPNKNFSWLWYYAMQQMGDDETQEQTQLLKQKLLQREAFTNSIAQFFPVLQTQQIFNSIGNSNLSNYVNFLDSTQAFHERKRLYFYPKIFAEAKVLEEDWQKQTPAFYSNTSNSASLVVLLPFLEMLLVLLIIIMVLRKKML